MLRHLVLVCVLCMVGSCALAQDRTCTSTIETVARQVGETVVFCGSPSQVHASKKEGGPIHINFGGKYPEQVFSVVIFADVAGGDSKEIVERYSGKALRVRGMVKTYNGKPEIKLRSLKDIEVE